MKNSNFDIRSAEKIAVDLFECLGIKLPDETPGRFVKMLSEMTRYQNVSNQEIADIVDKSFEMDAKTSSREMVLVDDIASFSLCEHHIALIYDMKISIAYVPQGKILGLSKIVRAADMVCRRLQLQEKIGEDIVEVMSFLNGNKDVAVYITAKHSCITARGIKNSSVQTTTTKLNGVFLSEPYMRDLFLGSIRR